MPERSIVVVVVGAAWLLSPLVCAALHQFVQDHWIVQQTSQQYWWMAGAGLLFATGYLWLPTELVLKQAWVCALWAALFGWFAGPLAMNAVNGLGQAGAATSVDATLTTQLRVSVVFTAGDGAGEAARFECSKSAWGPIDGKPRTLSLRRGRLGLLWAQFR